MATANKSDGLSDKNGAGMMQHVEILFPVKFASNPMARFKQAIKIMEQLHKQCNKQVTALAWELIAATSRELKKILDADKVHGSHCHLTQRGNITVIHADTKSRTFGKRYTLQVDQERLGISLAVAGSNQLYDLFIDINPYGNLLSCKAAVPGPHSNGMLMELQMTTMPSENQDCDNYIYSVSYHSSNRPAIKNTAANDALEAMEMQLRRLSLTPALYAETGKGIQKIPAKEFEGMFGVKLTQRSFLACNGGRTNGGTQILKGISKSYRRLRPHIDGRIEYKTGITNGTLLGVSQRSLLNAILAQIRKKQYLPKVVIVRINDLVGYGLVAGEHIPAGTIIGEYCGEISDVTAGKGKKKDNTYFAPYAPDEIPGSEMLVIDARKNGNSVRFINHSDENSNAVWMQVFDGSRFRMVIAAVKPILKGRQILLKYKRSYWQGTHIQNPCPLR